MRKAVIVYYSMDGNTRLIAEKVRSETGAPLARLRPRVPYTGTDEEIIAQGQDEVNRGYRPELMPLEIQPEDYDTFVVGTPTWWYTMASPVLSFLSTVDWRGKTLIPFQTHAGWPGHCLEDMERLCQGARVLYPKAIHFSPQQFGKMETPQRELEQWQAQIKTWI